MRGRRPPGNNEARLNRPLHPYVSIWAYKVIEGFQAEQRPDDYVF